MTAVGIGKEERVFGILVEPPRQHPRRMEAQTPEWCSGLSSRDVDGHDDNDDDSHRQAATDFGLTYKARSVQILWLSLAAVALWSVWPARNNFVFNGSVKFNVDGAASGDVAGCGGVFEKPYELNEGDCFRFD
ncbi:hypothetical protein V6N11_083084 [Hibiscus sabdariffa]|uniref:Uncharacterized protein n=1 Tax=Hibiscus sabdariffa TaxID=183260 RepID=A0ABR2QLB1_9ROSI